MRVYVMMYFVLVCTLQLHGQKVLKVEVLDKNTLNSIPNVKLFIEMGADSTQSGLSNPNGSLTIKIDDFPSGLLISAQHPLYEPAFKKVGPLRANQDTFEIKLYLTRLKEKLIQEVVLKSPGLPDTIFNSTEYSVSDFELLPDGKYILLAYPKRIGKESVLFYFDGNVIISTRPVMDEIPIQLIKDFRDQVHLVCRDKVLGIHIENTVLELTNISKNYFFQYISPIVDSATNKLFFSNFNSDYPAFDYFSYDQVDSSYRKLLHIEDKLMMELYRSEIKWVDVRTRLWAKQKELDSGIDAEIWVGANYFTQSIYYKEVYAPLFKVGDSLYIFDYYHDCLTVFNALGDSIRSCNLFIHYNKNKTGWKREMIQDGSTDEIYSVFEKDGHSVLAKINLNNASIQSKFELHFSYLEKIRINNSRAYYIYRPFESIQKKFLYREKLL